MAEEIKTCPTLLQQLAANAQRPLAAFSLGVLAGQGGPELVNLVLRFVTGA